MYLGTLQVVRELWRSWQLPPSQRRVTRSYADDPPTSTSIWTGGYRL